MDDDRMAQSIAALAREAGVLTEWIDAWGNPRTVAEADLLAVLAALTGERLDTENAIEATRRELNGSRPPIEPVVVAWDGYLAPVPIGEVISGAVLVLEDDSEIPVRVEEASLSVDERLPIGYHRLVVNDDGYATHVFSAPRKAHPAPTGATGLIAPTYSMRTSDSDAGIGTIGQLRTFADLCNDVGIEVVGTLPILAAFPDAPSPYSPASRRAWNEVFVDFASIPGWERPAPSIPGDKLWVDYRAAGHAIRRSLAEYAAHVSETPRLRSRVDSYLTERPEMARYARFCATADSNGRDWRAWPQSADTPTDRIAYHETVQWLMHTQLAELSQGLEDRGQYLYLDLPIGCHPDGYDIWDAPDQFAEASLGAPPDTLFVGGQDWGLPATIPSAARSDGHLNFRKAIAHQLSAAGLLRIDHVMGIHRTWWVPHGVEATDGAYVRQPTEEMFAVICIESVRAATGVVGENLGTVPPEIRTGLDEHELLGMANTNDGVTEPEPTDLAFVSSHDTPAFASWWKGSDIDDLLDLGVFDEDRVSREREGRASAVSHLQHHFGTNGAEETRNALMTWMASTNAAVALFSLDDLLMEERRQNVPGTDRERPNWRMRYNVTLEELARDDDLMAVLAHLVSIRSEGDNAK